MGKAADKKAKSRKANGVGIGRQKQVISERIVARDGATTTGCEPCTHEGDKRKSGTPKHRMNDADLSTLVSIMKRSNPELLKSFPKSYEPEISKR